MRTSAVGSASRPWPGASYPRVPMQKLFPASSCECTGKGYGELRWSFHIEGMADGHAGRLFLGHSKEGLRALSTL